MENSTAKARNIGVDLLRILSMFAIVLLHCCVRSGFLASSPIFSLRYNITSVILFLCYGAVDLYLLISGYVNIKAKYKLSRILFLWLEVVFYNLLITISFKVISQQSFSFREVMGMFTPLLRHEYWFFTRYTLLFALMPLLNMLANKLTKKRYGQMLIVMFCLFCIVGTIVKCHADIDLFILKNGYSTVWFVALYLLGAYIRLYGIHIKVPNIVWLISYFIFVLLAVFDAIIFPYLTESIFGFKLASGLTSAPYLSLFILLGVLSLLIFFSNLKVKRKQSWVTPVGALTFGVYLIHDNPIIRHYIMESVLKKLNTYPNALGSVALLLLFAVGVFILCLGIDFLRSKIFNCLKIRELCNKFVCVIGNKIFKRITPIYKIYFKDT